MSLSRLRCAGSNRWLRWPTRVLGLVVLGVSLSAQPSHTDYGLPSHYVQATEALRDLGQGADRMSVEGAQVFSTAFSRLEMQHDSREIRLNGLRIFMGEAALAGGGEIWVSDRDVEKLLQPLLQPKTLAAEARPVSRIMIDAGHGGKDRGTHNDSLALSEKDVALDVALQLGQILAQQGFEVIQTRTDDTYVEKGARARQGQLAEVDLFVSVHFNAAGNPAAEGSETYVLSPAGQNSTGDMSTLSAELPAEAGNITDGRNALLGYEIHRAMISRLGTVDRGLKRARFAVLRLSETPAVLIEAGFLSHEEEARGIASPARRGEIAEAIANGVVAYSNQILAIQPDS